MKPGEREREPENKGQEDIGRDEGLVSLWELLKNDKRCRVGWGRETCLWAEPSGHETEGDEKSDWL